MPAVPMARSLVSGSAHNQNHRGRLGSLTHVEPITFIILEVVFSGE